MSALPTTRPAYITSTRSADVGDDAEIVRDQQDRRAAVARADRFISSSTCAWIVTSRAVVGSSAIRSFGLQASAIAIITRWRMPPENWCG